MGRDEYEAWEARNWDKWHLGINLVLSKSLVEVARRAEGQPIPLQGFNLLRKKLRDYSNRLATTQDFSCTLGDDLYEAFVYSVIKNRKSITPRELSVELAAIVDEADDIPRLSPERSRAMETFLQKLTEQYLKVVGRKESYRSIGHS